MQHGRYCPNTHITVFSLLTAVASNSLKIDAIHKLKLVSCLYRPISKRKAWKVTEIIRREKVYDPVAAAEAAAAHVKQQQQMQQTEPLNRGFAASALT